MREAWTLIKDPMRRARWSMVAIVLLGILAALAETGSVGLVLLLLSLMFGGPDGGHPDGDYLDQAAGVLLDRLDGSLPLAALLLVGLIVIRIAIVALHGVVTSQLAARIGDQARRALFDACVTIGFEEFRARSWGEMYTVVEQQSYAVPEALDAVCNIIQALTILAIMGVLLILAAPGLAVIAALMMVLLDRLIKAVGRPVERAGEAGAAAARAMSEQLIRMLQAARTYRAFGLTRQQNRRFAEVSGRVARAQARADLIGQAAEPASHIAVLIAVVAMAALADLTALGHGVTIVAVGLLYRMQPYAASLEENRLILAEHLEPLRLVDAMLARRRPARTDFEAPPPLARSIRFEGVFFAYANSERPVFDRLGLDIPAGGWTLIQGESGAGKSTLVNLLLGLLSPRTGRILVDGRPLASLDPDRWRQQLAVCGQDIDLIHGSIRDNLRLGDDDASEERIAEAIAIADLRPMLAGLPDGIETIVGEQGSALSGGQKQRIAIARAMLRRPQLLILDEATSALDGHSQAVVLKRIEKAMAGRTVLVIGHGLTALPPLAATYNLGPLKARPFAAQTHDALV